MAQRPFMEQKFKLGTQTKLHTAVRVQKDMRRGLE